MPVSKRGTPGSRRRRLSLPGSLRRGRYPRNFRAWLYVCHDGVRSSMRRRVELPVGTTKLVPIRIGAHAIQTSRRWCATVPVLVQRRLRPCLCRRYWNASQRSLATMAAATTNTPMPTTSSMYLEQHASLLKANRVNSCEVVPRAVREEPEQFSEDQLLQQQRARNREEQPCYRHSECLCALHICHSPLSFRTDFSR